MPMPMQPEMDDEREDLNEPADTVQQGTTVTLTGEQARMSGLLDKPVGHKCEIEAKAVVESVEGGNVTLKLTGLKYDQDEDEMDREFMSAADKARPGYAAK